MGAELSEDKGIVHKRNPFFIYLLTFTSVPLKIE